MPEIYTSNKFDKIVMGIGPTILLMSVTFQSKRPTKRMWWNTSFLLVW